MHARETLHGVAEYLRGWSKRHIIDEMPLEMQEEEEDIKKCEVCGELYINQRECDCWKCSGCGESFSDHDMLGNRKEWLCLFCEDERVNK